MQKSLPSTFGNSGSGSGMPSSISASKEYSVILRSAAMVLISSVASPFAMMMFFRASYFSGQSLMLRRSRAADAGLHSTVFSSASQQTWAMASMPSVS